jgi:hypothetical protein
VFYEAAMDAEFNIQNPCCFLFLRLVSNLNFFFFEISTPRDIKDLFFVYI